MKSRLFLWLIAFCVFVGAQALAKETILVPMRDGVRLATDVHKPESANSGPLPVILGRTPYNKNSLDGIGAEFVLQVTEVTFEPLRRGQCGRAAEHRVHATERAAEATADGGLVGGGAFYSREEVETLSAALMAIERPDDELAIFATLRGPLFALSDAALLLWRERIGSLFPFRRIPEELPAALTEVADALEVLKGLHRRRNFQSVGDTITQLIEATRAHASFAIWPTGMQALANIGRFTDLARRAERQQHAVPLHRLITRQPGGGDGGKVGHAGPASRAAHPQRTQPAGLDVRQRGHHVIETRLHLAADQGDHCRRTALERHMHQIDPRHILEQLHGQMGRGSNARRCIVDASRLRACISDEFRDGF